MFSLLKNKPFLHATAILMGTMIGVGIFGIPLAFAKAGFWIGFLFLAATAGLTLFLYYIYGEIILRTHKPHQMVGYTDLYLGGIWKRIIFFSIILTTYAALLAYIIIAGDFLANIFSPFLFLTSGTFSIWFFTIGSILVFFGVKTVARIEFFLALLFIAIIALIFIVGFNDINFTNYSNINLEFWFFPYGVLLFAFSGASAIPIQRRILADNENYMKKSIFFAMALTALLYLVFGFTVVGISGDATSPDGISGLIGVLGNKIVFLGSLFGILAVSTSYLMVGTALTELFHLDYGFGRKLSLFLVVVPPFILFLGGLRNFIDVISLAGAVAIGLQVFVLVFVYMKAKSHGDRIPEYSMAVPAIFLYLVALMFLGGIGYTLWTR